MLHRIVIKWSKSIKCMQDNQDKIPEVTGVYEFLLRSSEKTWWIYVGKAENLRERFLQHLQEEEPNECLKKNLKSYPNISCFRFASVSSKADREDAEQVLYDKHKYECNEKRPEGSGRGYEISLVESD